MKNRTPAYMQRAVLAYIERAAAGAGVRTTELWRIQEEVGWTAQDVSNAVADLYEQAEVRTVTENFRPQDAVPGDYCWLVPQSWVDSPRRGYEHVPKVDCPLFSLFPRPTIPIRPRRRLDWLQEE